MGVQWERKRPTGILLLPAAPCWGDVEDMEMEVPSDGTRSSVTSCKKGNVY